MTTSLTFDQARTIITTLAKLQDGKHKICFKENDVQLEDVSGYNSLRRALWSNVDKYAGWERDLNKFNSQVIEKIVECYKAREPSLRCFPNPENVATGKLYAEEISAAIRGMKVLQKNHYTQQDQKGSSVAIETINKALGDVKKTYENFVKENPSDTKITTSLPQPKVETATTLPPTRSQSLNVFSTPSPPAATAETADAYVKENAALKADLEACQSKLQTTQWLLATFVLTTVLLTAYEIVRYIRLRRS